MTDNELSEVRLSPPMANTPPNLPTLRVPLIVIALTLAAFGALIYIAPPTMPKRLFGLFLLPGVATAGLMIWWLFQRSVPRRARLVALGGALIAAAVSYPLAEKPGKTWFFVMMWGIPLAFALVVVIGQCGRWLRAQLPPALLTLAGVIAFTPWFLIRTNGQVGDGLVSFTWRWSSSHEQRLNDWMRDADAREVITAAELIATPGDWPAFRGPARNSVVTGVKIQIAAGSPVEIKPSLLWKHPIGDGWSSFAVVGNLAVTHEQRPNGECVVCYDIRNGKQIWVHTDDNQFNEMSGGAGPRSTPALADGQVFSFGPTGILNCLDAATGKLIWKVTTHVKQPGFPKWGYASSPLVVDGKVIIGPSGGGGVKLAAYDTKTGTPLWSAAGGKEGYSSPVLGTLCGVSQLVFIDGAEISGHSIADGSRLWAFPWPTDMPKSAAPVVVDDSTVLVGMGYGNGLKLLKISHGAGNWAVTEKWHTSQLKPKFNDLVVYSGFIYGLDEGYLTCVNLTDGRRIWRKEHYGYGQLLLVGSHLLVQAESGEVAIVEASHQGFNEVARFEALDGKTWAHPVLVRGKLLVRNSDDTACYDLSPWLVKCEK